MVQVQHQFSVYFCMKINFKSWFLWLIWPFECLILMILKVTKYQEYLLRDSPLSLLFAVKFFSTMETKKVPKITKWNLFRNNPIYVLIEIQACELIQIVFNCNRYKWFALDACTRLSRRPRHSSSMVLSSYLANTL